MERNNGISHLFYTRIHSIFYCAFVWLAYLILAVPCIAQQNTYSHVLGKVIDENTRRPIAGASVLVKEEKIGDATDLTGRYDIILPPGTFTINVSHPHYQSSRRDCVTVREGKKTVLNVSLLPILIDTLYWKAKAESDIAVGDVHIYSCDTRMPLTRTGLFDSILRKYGFSYRNNCKDPIEALKVYNKIVYRYLEIRNGPDWEKRLYDDLRKNSQKIRSPR